MSRGAYAALLGLLVVAGLRPWLGELALWPMAPDSATWIERADPRAPGWFDWTFLTSHFDVGWRPLTALAFTANRLLSGLEPFGYRLTDLALHGLTAVLVAALARRLVPGGRAWVGLVAAAAFLVHPVHDEVVPFLARRSYPLGSALGLAAALVFLGGRADARWARSLAAGALLALAVAANEVSVLFAAALPLLALVAPADRTTGLRLGRVLRASAWLALPVAVVLGLRFAVVGGLGGYELPPEVAAEPGSRAWRVFVAAWRELVGVARAPAAIGELGVSLPPLALASLLPLLVIASASTRVALVLALWTAAYPALYATQGVWFPRQAYVAAIPLALWLAVVADHIQRANRDRTSLGKLVHLTPQIAFAACLLLSTPLAWGPDPVRIAERAERNTLIHEALTDLRAMADERPGPEPLDVHLVLPYSPPREREDTLRARAAQRELSRASRLPARWLATLLAGTSVNPREFVYVLNEASPGPLATANSDGSLRVLNGGSYYVAVEASARSKARMVERNARVEPHVPAPEGTVWIAPAMTPKSQPESSGVGGFEHP